MSNTYIDVFKGVGIEINLKQEDDFLKVKETLTRIGIVSGESSNTLYQSCHILHKTDPSTKRSRYSIVHFKEMFLLDGKTANMTATDIQRRNAVVNLLSQWGLIRLPETTKLDTSQRVHLKIVSYSKKSEWKLVPKYTIGQRTYYDGNK